MHNMNVGKTSTDSMPQGAPWRIIDNDSGIVPTGDDGRSLRNSQGKL